MKYLTLFGLFICFSSSAQVGLDAKLRAKAGGLGLSQKNYTAADSAAVAQVRPTAGKNLFDVDAPGHMKGFYIFSGSGLPLANAAYNATGLLPVIAGQTYTPTAGVKQQLAFYDAAGTYVSGLDAARTNTYFTVPNGAAFVRLSVPIANWNTFQLELGQTPTAFAPYGNRLPKTVYPSLGAGSMTLARMQFAQSGKNLFNINDPDAKVGFYAYYLNGLILASSGLNVTGFIPVEPGQVYMPNHKHQVAFYDANRVFVSGLDSGRPLQYFVAPAGAAFVRLSVSAFNWSGFQLELGNTTTTFEAYKGYTLNPDIRLSTQTMDNALTTSAVAIAPKQYIPAGRELAIYSENVQKNFNEYRDKMMVDIPDATQKIIGRGTKITPAATGLLSGTVSVGDNQYAPLTTTPITVSVVSTTIATATKVLNIGDSYTLRSTFTNSLSATGGITYLGTRTSSASSLSVLSEGRGGFTLAQYTTHSTTLYMPFMQPTATYLYLGNTSFWIAARSGMSDAVGQGYDYNRFVTATQFNASTGYPTSPRTNDLIYDNGLSAYRNWNGSAWVTVSAPTFAFSFAKYRQAWTIDQPNIVHILLGTNDFGFVHENQFAGVYNVYKAGLDVMIASILADSPSAKIIVGMPVSSGRQGEFGTLFTERRKRAYWLLASALVADYAGKETTGRIYLADYHSTVDRQYGYDNTAELPFAYYTGAARDNYKADFTHLGADGFRQMADVYMGLIQALR